MPYVLIFAHSYYAEQIPGKMSRRAGVTASCQVFVRKNQSLPQCDPKRRKLISYCTCHLGFSEIDVERIYGPGREEASGTSFSLPFAFSPSFPPLSSACLIVLWLIMNTSRLQRRALLLSSAVMWKQSHKSSLCMFYSNDSGLCKYLKT